MPQRHLSGCFSIAGAMGVATFLLMAGPRAGAQSAGSSNGQATTSEPSTRGQATNGQASTSGQATSGPATAQGQTKASGPATTQGSGSAPDNAGDSEKPAAPSHIIVQHVGPEDKPSKADVHALEVASELPMSTPTPGVRRLPDPSPAQIQNIIQTFVAHERTFREQLARHYTYTETVRVDTLDGDGKSTGNYEQVDDLNFDPNGKREIVCTWCPQSSLQNVEVSEDDIDDFFNMNMYTISLEDLPAYKVTYIDHEPIDQLTAYIFDIRPKQMEPGKRYFEGKVWVDDHDLQIVKSYGKAVPNQYDKHGNPTNTFLPFETWRQQVDGKYWFPVFTRAHGNVGDTPVKMVMHFINYKEFHARGRVVSSTPVTPPKAPKP